MKLVWIFSILFLLGNCQQDLYSLNPRFYNALQFNARSLIDESSPQLMLYQPSWRQNAQTDNLIDPQVVVQSSNPLARLYLNNNYNNPGVYTPPISGSGTYNPNPVPIYYNSPAGPFWLKSRVYTAYVTTTVISLSYCIPLSQFSLTTTPPVCARRRREIAELQDALADIEDPSIDAAPVNLVEVTEIANEESRNGHSVSPSSLILSSKDEIGIRDKRLFNIFAVPPTTVTSYIFSTIPMPKPVKVHKLTDCGNADAGSCLLCVPPGYGVC